MIVTIKELAAYMHKISAIEVSASLSLDELLAELKDLYDFIGKIPVIETTEDGGGEDEKVLE